MATYNPDTIVKNWITAVEDEGAPALNMVDSTGRVYLKHCTALTSDGAKCKSPVRHYSYRIAGYVCGRCGAGWPYRDGFLLKGAVQRSRSVGGHESWLIATRIEHGRILRGWQAEAKWRWEVLLYAAHCQGMSVEDMSIEMTREFPECPGPWSRRSVYRRIQTARLEWIRRLNAAGLLTRPAAF